MNIQHVSVQEGPLLLCLNDRMENIYINFDVPSFSIMLFVSMFSIMFVSPSVVMLLVSLLIVMLCQC